MRNSSWMPITSGGFPSGTPNEKLLKPVRDIWRPWTGRRSRIGGSLRVLAELENTLARKSKAADNLVNNDADIQAVLDHRELLIQG